MLDSERSCEGRTDIEGTIENVCVAVADTLCDEPCETEPDVVCEGVVAPEGERVDDSDVVPGCDDVATCDGVCDVLDVIDAVGVGVKEALFGGTAKSAMHGAPETIGKKFPPYPPVE